MKRIEDEDLKMLRGGESITSSFINSVSNLIKILMSVGEKMGSAVRRIGSGTICPLE